MKGIKSSFIIFIFISQSIISNAKYIEKLKDYFGDYPYLNNLEKYFTKFDELNDGSIYSMLKNMDSETLKSIAEDFGKILFYGKTAIGNFKSVVNSLSEGIKELVGNSGKALSITLNFLGKHSLKILGIAAVAIPTYFYVNNKIDNLNNNNDRIGCEIERLINQKKYKDFIEEKIGNEIKNIINRGIAKLNLTKLIEDYLNIDNKLKEINEKFNGTIDSLNFIVIGNTGAGKSTFINKILDLKSGVNGAFVNEDSAEPTTLEFQKYKNDNKTGIQLIDTRGIESNRKYNTEYFMGNFTDYYYNYTMINESNSNFIYGILYIGEASSFSEGEIIKEIKDKYNRIPLKILYTRNKKDNEIKRLKQTIITETNISPYFLDTETKTNYEQNLKYFLNELLDELNEEKLKEIYQYYYTSNICDILKKKIIKINYLQTPLTSNSIKNPTTYILSKLELVLTTLLNQSINLELNQPIKDIYSYTTKTLDKDIKNLGNKDYSLKEYEERDIFDKIKEYFIKNPLPYHNISLGISQIINDIVIDKFLETIERELFKDIIKVRNYPNFTTIRNSIEKNFIEYHESTSFSSGYFIIIIISIIIVVAVFFIYKYCYCNKKRKEKKIHNMIEDQDIELNNIILK